MKNNNNDLQSHKELCFEPSLFDGGCAGEDILCILFLKNVFQESATIIFSIYALTVIMVMILVKRTVQL